MSYLKKTPIIKEGIDQFEVKELTSKIVSNFYKLKPFPNYKVNDDKVSVVQRGDKNLLAKQFKNFVGYILIWTNYP